MSGGALNVISAEPDATLAGIAGRCASTHAVSSLPELYQLLDGPQRDRVSALNLLGHSTRGHHYLRIGGTAIDMLDPGVARFFERLAASGVLQRRGITALRLLGCETAVEIAGQRTIARLAHVLGVAVYGTRKPLLKAHYDRRGFDPTFAGLLVEAGELPRPRRRLES